MQHGTGNASNASAWNEAQYFVNGAEIFHGRPAWDVYVEQWRAARADEMGNRIADVVPAHVPDFIAEDVTRGFPGDHLFEFEQSTAFACLREWTAKTDTLRRFTASLDSETVGQDLRAGDKFTGWYIFKVGQDWWVLTRMGTRLAMDDLAERVIIPIAG